MAKRDLPPELSAALRLAWALAARLGHACVGTEHLLLALAMQPQGADGRLLHWAGLTGPPRNFVAEWTTMSAPSGMTLTQ